MPEVDQPPDVEELFSRVRQLAAAESAAPGGPPRHHVVVVTPGRLLMQVPSPAPGSIPEEQVASMERLLSSGVRRQVAAIGYTELRALQTRLAEAIPFLGMLIGLAYIGHAVWVFE